MTESEYGWMMLKFSRLSLPFILTLSNGSSPHHSLTFLHIILLRTLISTRPNRIPRVGQYTSILHSLHRCQRHHPAQALNINPFVPTFNQRAFPSASLCCAAILHYRSTNRDPWILRTCSTCATVHYPMGSTTEGYSTLEAYSMRKVM